MPGKQQSNPSKPYGGSSFNRQDWEFGVGDETPCFTLNSNKLILGNFWLINIYHLQIDTKLIVSWINKWRLPFYGNNLLFNPNHVGELMRVCVYVTGKTWVSCILI